MIHTTNTVAFMTLGKAAFGRYKRGGEEFFSKKLGGRRVFIKKIRRAKTFFTKKGGEEIFCSTKKRGRRFFFRLIFPKTRPSYLIKFDQSLIMCHSIFALPIPPGKGQAITILTVLFQRIASTSQSPPTKHQLSRSVYLIEIVTF